MRLSLPHRVVLRTLSVESMASTAKAAEVQSVCAAIMRTFPMVGSTGNLAKLWPSGRVRVPSLSNAPKAINCSRALLIQTLSVSLLLVLCCVASTVVHLIPVYGKRYLSVNVYAKAS